MSRKHLLDVNVLLALTSVEHKHYREAIAWFDSLGRQEWGICPLTEAGYIRLVTNPAIPFGGESFSRAAEVLAEIAQRPGYRFWPLMDSWTALTAPFRTRIFGHQQVTDAYLLGLAISENGVLVTLDKGLKYMAGDEFSRNLLVLE